ncbi:MAG: hypothetical protein O4808_08010, partial [Trichodesmium sp. St17_bin3_1_1]|nr:hypothetical protein [Trichodesmium sp. St17_bin3_1_1]
SVHKGFEIWYARSSLNLCRGCLYWHYGQIPLQKYSPDLNDIEHDFSTLKRARMYSPINKFIDEIIRNYYFK